MSIIGPRPQLVRDMVFMSEEQRMRHTAKPGLAMVYRTVYLAYYLRKAILFRPFKIFIKHIIVDLLSILVIYFSTYWMTTEVSSYFSWVILAIKITIIGGVEVCVINLIFYKNECEMIFKKFFRRI